MVPNTTSNAGSASQSSQTSQTNSDSDSDADKRLEETLFSAIMEAFAMDMTLEAVNDMQ